MDKGQVIERIKKLLSRSVENGATEAEARTAMGHAQRLMDEHNVSMAEALIQDDGAGQFAEHTVWEGQGAKTQFLFAFPIIEDAFAVRALIVRRKLRTASGRGRTVGVRIAVFGDPVNVEGATWALSFLARTFRNLWNRYRRETAAGTSQMNDFYGGLQFGMLSQLRRERADRDRQLPGTGRSLVLVRDALDRAFQSANPRSTTVALPSGGDHDDAFRAGVEAGRRINLARPVEGDGGTNRPAIEATS